MPDLVGRFFFQHKKFTQFIAIRPLDSDIAKDVVLVETVFATRNVDSKESEEDGVPLDIISKRTGFTIEEIKAL